jgi:hypothetical protein
VNLGRGFDGELPKCIRLLKELESTFQRFSIFFKMAEKLVFDHTSVSFEHFMLFFVFFILIRHIKMASGVQDGGRKSNEHSSIKFL